MSNQTTKQITLDGPRNFVVKLTGVLDTSNVSLTPAISLSDAVNNDVRLTLVGFRLDRMEYSIGSGLEVQLAWNATTPQLMTPIAGRGKIDAWHYGGWFPNQQAAGFDGSINLTSTGYPAGTTQNYSVVLELVKLYTV